MLQTVADLVIHSHGMRLFGHMACMDSGTPARYALREVPLLGGKGQTNASLYRSIHIQQTSDAIWDSNEAGEFSVSIQELEMPENHIPSKSQHL